MTSLPKEEKKKRRSRRNPENLAAGKLAASWQPTLAHPAAAPTVAAARFRLLSRRPCKRVSAGCAYHKKTSSTAAAATEAAATTQAAAATAA